MKIKRLRILSVVLATLVAWPVASQAGILFKKSTKPNPAERVPELLGVLKTEKDEHKRVSAAEELKQYDPAAYPDIIAVLADAVVTDASSSVRAEAADSLGHFRPMTQQAGLALEQALAKDTSMKVRMQARYALLQMHWAGYRSATKEGPIPIKELPTTGKESKAPPLIQMPLKPQQTGAKFGESTPPPLAPPAETAVSSKGQAKGKTPAPAPLVPIDPPVLKPLPTSPPTDQGPELTPPQ